MQIPISLPCVSFPSFVSIDTHSELCATQEEKRAHTARYYFAKESTNTASSPSAIAGLAPEEMRGKKRARAEDFL